MLYPPSFWAVQWKCRKDGSDFLSPDSRTNTQALVLADNDPSQYRFKFNILCIPKTEDETENYVWLLLFYYYNCIFYRIKTVYMYGE